MLKQTALAQSLPWLGTSPLEFICFIAFWVAQLSIVWKGMDGIRVLEKYAAPILIVLTSCLLAWAYVNAGGFGHMLSLSSRLSTSEFWSLFFPSLTANISFWGTLALNTPDFTVIPGFLVKVGILNSVPNAFVVIYNNACFISLFSAGIVYWILSFLLGTQRNSQLIDPLQANEL